ncbi:hypothetical protein EHQ53_05765 [Leptospira langatensis]|uniref:Uncharacterized protein n=1 Tax=Leptospira langatensis TaxID=2484983 RepID=A0A5F1ZVW3_9LEPT|nr:hypothetical protein [Leptospira langatensis]TGK02972.1 hypothetical protein EHO57_06600 [Leptospira langatensis]TGL41727.1 hypothetical protein EHQ53_05765 [Leptospira langatensis]
MRAIQSGLFENFVWKPIISLNIALVLVLGPIFSLQTLYSQEKSSAIDKIWENIYSQDFITAKKLVQKELQTSDADSLQLLSLMEICLNGLERYKQADDSRKKILSVWEKNHKKAFVEENYPLNLATWTRIVKVTPNVLVLGAEYYLPYPVNAKKDGFYYHKFTAYNRFTKRPSKFFKLEKSPTTDKEYRLFEISEEGEAILVKSYGNALPDMREEMKDVLKHLKLQ